MASCALVRAASLALLGWTLATSQAHSQSVAPGPPGPYVFDVRATTMGVPQAFGFYPDVPTDILVPSRGFGIDVGGHVYAGRVGPARLGIGGSFAYLRGTAGDEVAITVRTFAPQISLNFGTSRGWSHLSGGVGLAQVRGRYSPQTLGEAETLVRSSGGFMAVNGGGGARWFIRPRLAFTLDLRVYRFGARAGDAGAAPTPASFLGAASAGFSFR